MNVSPLDLRQQRFRNAVRGYDKVEVTSFLAAVADDYETALRETDRLKQELAKAEALLKEHRDHEGSLKATLVTVQRLSDEMKANAEKEAQRILDDAATRSSLMLEKAQSRLEDIQREIDGMRLKRKDVETTLEATIQTLRNTLDFVRDQDERGREDKAQPARPRPVAAPEAPRTMAAVEGARPVTAAPDNSRPVPAAEGPRPVPSAEGPRPVVVAEGPRPVAAVEAPRPDSTDEDELLAQIEALS
jgi:cell division initiation protein